jgi:hypothetical protein
MRVELTADLDACCANLRLQNQSKSARTAPPGRQPVSTQRQIAPSATFSWAIFRDTDISPE